MMKRALAALAVLLAACGGDDTPLSKIADRTLHVSLDLKSLRVFDPFGNSSQCLKLDAVATMNGVALERVWPGGKHLTLGGWIPHPVQECFNPEWMLPEQLPDTPVTELEVHDDTGRLLFGVDALGAARAVSWISPESGAARWGDGVAVRFSPATDYRAGLGVHLVGGGRDMEISMGGNPRYSARDDFLTFALPDAPLDQGSTAFDGGLQFFQSVLPGTAHCEPYPDGCFALISVDGARSVPISIR